MLMLGVGERLTAEVASWASDALCSGVAARCGGVAVGESLLDEALVSDAPATVLMHRDTGDDAARRAAASAAAAVVWVSDGPVEGLRAHLGLERGPGWRVPVAVVLLGGRKLDKAAGRFRSGAQQIEVLPAVLGGRFERRLRRRLRRIGRRYADAAAASQRFEAADASARRLGAKSAARRVVNELIEASDVEEYQIVGGEFMRIEYASGERRFRDSPFGSGDDLVEAAKFMAAYGGDRPQRFDRLSPTLDVMVAGWRVHVEAWQSTVPTMVLRSNRLTGSSLSDLGVADDDLVAVLVETMAGRTRANCVFAGPMGSGKTTLAQHALSHVPANERIDTIEDTLELRLREKGFHRFTVEHQTREANTEGLGRIDQGMLVYSTKRSNTDKIVVGEIRGPGTVALLDAMSLALSGCLVTLHSQPGRGVLEKLVEYACSDGDSPLEARRKIAASMHLLVWMGRNHLGQRAIADVTQIEGVDDAGAIATKCLWTLRDGDRWASPVSSPTGYVRRLYESAGVDVAARAQGSDAVLAGPWIADCRGFSDPTAAGGAAAAR